MRFFSQPRLKIAKNSCEFRFSLFLRSWAAKGPIQFFWLDLIESWLMAKLTDRKRQAASTTSQLVTCNDSMPRAHCFWATSSLDSSRRHLLGEKQFAKDEDVGHGMKTTSLMATSVWCCLGSLGENTQNKHDMTLLTLWEEIDESTPAQSDTVKHRQARHGGGSGSGYRGQLNSCERWLFARRLLAELFWNLEAKSFCQCGCCCIMLARY